MNRAELKARARESMSWARPSPVLVTLIYTLIPFLLAIIVAINGGLAAVGGGLFAAAKALWLFVLVIIVGLLYSVLEAGYIKYCLDVSRNRPASYSTLFEFVGQPFRFIGLGLLTGLVSGAVSLVTSLATGLLAAIPLLSIGVYLAALVVTAYITLGFSLAFWVAVDRPELGIVDCMRESWQLMAGRRWEYFVLQLSFILWVFACILIVPIFWVNPYMEITIANYYSLLTGQLPRENHPPGEQPWQHGGGWPPEEADAPEHDPLDDDEMW